MSELRILLVEDDVGVARMLERGLTQAGYQVDWQRTLGDAVGRVSRSSHPRSKSARERPASNRMASRS